MEKTNKVLPVNAGANASANGHAAPGLSEFFEGSPVPAFAIDANHRVTQWNRACEFMTGMLAKDVIGTDDHWKPLYDLKRPVLADLIVDGALGDEVATFYANKCWPSLLIPGAYEAEDFFPMVGAGGRWLAFSAAPLHDSAGNIVGAIEILQDVTKQKVAEAGLAKIRADLEQRVARRTDQLARSNARLEEDIRRREEIEAELLRRNAELTELNARLSTVQQQLIQADKLASIGQLAAGVAHEINNPIGYIFSNFGTLESYLVGLMDMLTAYEQAEPLVSDPAVRDDLAALRQRIELDYLKEDIPVMMRESLEGIVRVRKIVQDLKDFSRVENYLEWQWTNLHQGIDSTLNIVNNEVKYKADVIREYGDLPDVECLPSQINQVIMNLVINAAHAIGPVRGTITIRTGTGANANADADTVWIEVADSGCGISAENQARIFDPFFTTKPIGKGTGLGLSLAYGIISKHNGQIQVDSTVGVGTRFRIILPLRQPVAVGG